jgi:hypothetical protein
MTVQNDPIFLCSDSVKTEIGPDRGRFELPVDVFDHRSDLIDRVFAFAFDVLGLQTVELRVHLPRTEVGNGGLAHASSPDVVPIFDAM